MRDLTDRSVGKHAINIVLDKLVAAIERWTELNSDVRRSSPVVTIADNYDHLYYEADAVARGARYSHYVDDNHILRTQTTAAIPSLLRENLTDDRLLVCPGLVYRRDVMDRMHVGEPHQVDLWIIKKARLRRPQLLAMIDAVLQAILPGCEYRCNETIHPYTVNGLEVEVLWNDQWVEVLECGEAHPWLLNDNGHPSQEWSGLAMGLGLDRLVMLLKGMDDIRLLRSEDARIAGQMLDLEPYRPVSSQPAAKRDMSLTVSDPDMEIIGDRIRKALGAREDWIEEIEAVGVHSYDTVPEKARERLGMLPGQTNLLIRLHMRSPSESIPRETANEVYDLVYSELHEGTGGYARA